MQISLDTVHGRRAVCTLAYSLYADGRTADAEMLLDRFAEGEE